jgi:lipid-binding SYLF domain-containing protein
MRVGAGALDWVRSYLEWRLSDQQKEQQSMFACRHLAKSVVVAATLAILAWAPGAVAAASAAAINRDATAALAKLYQEVPAANDLAKKAKAVLIFPSVVKGGLLVGGQYGEGVLRKGGKTKGYYSTASVSYGLQAGAQNFGYVLLFMTNASLKYLDQSEGWEVGVGPSVVVVDEGMARTLTTTTARDDIYAFIFGQKGLMAGLGVQGSKITRIHPGK